MSRSIDERIVEMRFDNQQFESGVKTTMGSLDKLKSALKLDGITSGFDKLGTAAKGVNLNPLQSAVETASSKFSALEVVAITALANITNSAVNAGKQLVKSLTIDQVKAGFAEYELKMGSVQTIMASTGESIETVNGYLEELNKYSDQTIYSFSDMTASIGKFTNAGVKLDDAVAAIKGISNEAAVSGANAQEASRAMYNFAQALSAGYVKLIDWKSIENANMATVEFKQSLIDTAVAMGTVVKEGDKYVSTTTDANGKVSELFDATSMFNDSLSAQWMSTDVLVQTLNNYANDVSTMTDAEKKAYEEKLKSIGYTEEQIAAIEKLGTKAFASAQDVKTFSQLLDTLREAAGSGWAQTFEIIFGDLEEAKKLWTGVSEVVGGFIDATSNARNEVLKGWDALGGRVDLLASVRNMFYALINVLKPVKEAFREIFPRTTAEQLHEFTKRLRGITAALRDANVPAESIKSTFRGVFSVFKIIGTVIKGVAGALRTFTDEAATAGNGILAFTGNIGDKIYEFSQTIRSGDITYFILQSITKIKDAFNKAISILDTAKGKINGFVQIVTGFSSVGELLDKIKEKILGAVTAIKEFASTHFNAPDTSGLDEFASKVKEKLGPIATIGEKLTGLFSGIGRVVKGLFGVVSAAFGKIGPIVLRVAETVVNAIGDILDAIGKAINGDGFDSLLDLANGGMLLAIGVNISKFIKSFTEVPESLSEALGSFGDIGKGVKSVLDSATSALKSMQQQVKANILQKIAISIGILAASLLVLSMIPSEKLSGALISISVLFQELIHSLKILSGDGIKANAEVNMAASTMIKVAAAMLVLSFALKQVGSMDLASLAKGLVGIGISLRIMIATLSEMSKMTGDTTKAAGSLLIFASAMVVLGLALKIMGSMNFEQLITALAALAGSLLVISLTLKALDQVNTTETAAGMLLIAGAMVILGAALKIMGSLKFEQLITALAALAGSLLILTMVFKALEQSNTTETAAGMLIIAAAMVVLGAALKIMGSLKFEELITALAALAGSLLVMSMTIKALDGSSVAKTAAGVLIFAGALVVLAAALKMMSSLKFEQLITALAALAASMLVLVLSFKALEGTNTAGTAAGIMVMSAALIVLSVALKSLGSMKLSEIGKALLALIGSLAALGVMSAVLTPVIPLMIALAAALLMFGAAVLAAGVGIMTLSIGLTALAGTTVATASAIVASLGIILIGILDIIAKSADKFAAAVKALVLAAVSILVECAPAVAEGAFQLVLEALRILDDYLPAIIETLLDFVIKIIDGVAAKVPELIKSIANLIQQIFNGIIEAIGSFSADGIDGVLDNLLGVAKILAVVASFTLLGAMAMPGVIALGAVIAEVSLVLAALGLLNQIPGLKWFINEGGELLESIGTAIGKFVGGFVGGAMSSISASLPGMADNLSQFMVRITPFLAGAAMIKPTMFDGVQTLAKTILLLTAANIVEGLTSWFTGGSSLSKFGDELAEFGPKFSKYADSVSGVDPATVTASANAALALAQMADTLPNSGGLAGKIFGENSLAQFGEELAKFGPYISEYAGSVKGVNPGAVQASVEAAQMLADMSNTLPNSGGAAAKIFGDNTLSAFGEELEKFGPHISKYAESVKGVNPAAVQSSVEAAQMLSDMANTLPNSGGMVSWFTGDNTLSAFGEELEKFGPKIAAYANNIKDMDPAVVEASANAAKALSELASNLPNNGGLAGLFTGNNDIGKFGESLEKFGAAFAKYYASVSTVSPEIMNSVTTAVSALVDLAQKAGGLDKSALTNFAKDLEGMGSKGVEGFVNSFAKAGPKVQNGIKILINTANSSLKGQTSVIKSAAMVSGQELITGMILGIDNKKNILISNVKSLCSQLIQNMRTSLPAQTFISIGQEIVKNIITGINNKKAEAKSTVNSMCKLIISTFKSGLNAESLKPIGAALIEGLAKGIKSGGATLEDASKEISNSLIVALKKYINVDTFKPLGAAAAEGLKKGLTDKIGEIAKAASDAAKKAVKDAEAALGGSKSTKESTTQAVQSYVDAMDTADDQIRIDAVKTAQAVATILAEAISNELSQPVIRPVLDMSDVYGTSAELQNGLNTIVSARLATSADSYKNVNALADLTSNLEKIETEGNNNIIGAIQELRSDVNTLNANMSRLQVVLDSGTLIGELAPGMDAKLGNIAKLKARGV